MIKKIKNLFTKQQDTIKEEVSSDKDFKIFLEIVESYMRTNHPKIKIDYSSESFQDEPSIKVRKSLMVSSIIKQFVSFEYTKTTQMTIPKDMLWQGYNINSAPNPKYPSDFLKRKELAYIRDGKCCHRCGKFIKNFTDDYTVFAKDINDGGTYHLENIITTCADCYKILNSEQKGNLYLTLNDTLLDFIKD